MRSQIGKLLATLLLLAQAACLNINYVRFSNGEPIPDDQIEGLVSDEAELQTCLDRLGAPDIVWSSEIGAVRLAYVWLDSADWGFSLGYSFERFVSARFEFDSTDENIEALVLMFGPDLILHTVERGYLRDLAPEPIRGGD